MFARLLKTCVAVFAVVSIACAPSKLSVREMNVASPSLMIAKKSPLTAYLVLDPERVPDTLPVLVDAKARGGRLEDVQTFVSRDLVRAFESYFDKVEVVAPGQLPAGEPHALIDVKLERVEIRVGGTSGGVSYGFAAMTWGMGLRLSDSDNYLFSFAGESAGTPTGNIDVAFRSMFEAAITGMLKAYTDKEIHAKVLVSSQPMAVPARVETTDI